MDEFKLVASAVAVLLWGVWLVALLGANGAHPLRALFGGFSALGWIRRAALLFLVVQLTLFAGAKHETNRVDAAANAALVTEVSGLANVVASPSPAMASPAPSAASGGAEDPVTARVGTNETFCFDRPEGAAVATNWLLRGAATDRLRLDFADWAFPFGGGNATSLSVRASGEVSFRPDGGSLVPFGAPLGIVPEANWRLLTPPAEQSNVSPSLFWWAFTPSNTLQLTWRNALLGRETNSPVSFQAELNPNGAYVFRYDLTHVADGGLLTDAVIAAGEGVEGVPTPHAGLSSVSVLSADDRRCDEFRDEFEDRLGGEDPFAVPEGSTNTVLEHVFYAGTTNGPFSLPQSSDGFAVLRVSVSGSGSGELTVGSSFVPLRGRPAPLMAPRLLSSPAPRPSFLLLAVPRGATCPVYMRGDGTLSVSFSSSDFAFGELPDLSGRHFRGWINFPYVKATVPCIHDYTARQKLVSLPAGEGAGELKCTWHGSAQIGVESLPPRAALLTGRFSGKATTPVSYTLSHPKYLFGQATHTQTARYCPRPPEEEEDEDEGEGEGGETGGGEPTHGDDGPTQPGGDDDGGGGSGGDGDEPHDPEETGGDPRGEDEPDAEEDDDGRKWWDEPADDEPTDPDDDPEPEEPEPEEDPDEDDEDEARASCQLLTGVLKLRDPIEYSDPIRLVVPDEHRNCCPCPDHASNWVAVVYQSGLVKVVDCETEQPFSVSGRSLDVKVAGLAPSSKAGDAEIAFGVNGEVVKQGKYTVLGVGIGNGYVPNVGTVDLRALNALNDGFGLPVPVGTNGVGSSSLGLKARVRLAGGNVRVGLEDVTGDFTIRYYDRDEGEWRVLADATTPSRSFAFSHWRRAACDSSEDPEATVYVESAAAGSATLVFRYWNVVGGRFVSDEARQRLTAVNPPLLPDVDRDGRIDEADAQDLADGRLFRFWCNEDTDKGDYIGQSGDSRPNWATDPNQARVNGKLDLVNLFPVLVDVSAFRRAWGNLATFRLYDDSGLLRHCRLSDVSPDEAGSIQTSAVETDAREPLESAVLHAFDRDGVDVGDWLDENGRAMLAVMAGGPVEPWYGPELVVSLGDSDVFRCRLPLKIDSVDAMYRYLNLRGAEAGGTFVPMLPGMPPNLPDDETDGRNYVFVHGYNVNASQSRAWARAMFKRLWWAGSKSKFTAVDWFGNYSQIADWVSPNYYQNVVHALRTAPALKAACDALPGEKVMLAHSLGNMLTCEAIAHCGLQYSKYYMLNAAVPAEAFNAEADAETNMQPLAWQRYSDALFACNWYRGFPRTDGRRSLTWRGIFAGVHDAVNCYSPTEDVLGNAPVVGAGGAWSAQELLKGTGTMYFLPRVRREGGWGFNPDHTVPLSQNGELLKTEYTDEEMVTSPPFLPFAEDWLHSTNAVTSAQVAEVRDRILADGIPAQTFAAGANAISGVSGNYNMDSLRNDRWPSNRDGWFHSDLKNVAFWYTYKLFQKIVKGE